ncbi:probable GPI-anchored adhesin-like protein PGA55 [Patiria miniata]|uniref:Interleukin 17-like protein n=1 Tax=Patiria miniata TaxID=46514 RepID=A0A913ZNS5_PATMI|nr:probable GPI-anchored adhesin-like protein PGA55 [Patiria miniata]
MSPLCNVATILLVLSMLSSSRSLVIRRDAPPEETTSVTMRTRPLEVMTSRTSDPALGQVTDAPNQLPVLWESSESSEVNNIPGAFPIDYEEEGDSQLGFFDSQIQDEDVDIHSTEATTVDSTTTSTVASTTPTNIPTTSHETFTTSQTEAVTSSIEAVTSSTEAVTSSTEAVTSSTEAVTSSTEAVTSSTEAVTSSTEAVTSSASLTRNSSATPRENCSSGADTSQTQPEPHVTLCQEPPEHQLRLNFKRNNQHLKFPALAILPQEVAPHQEAGPVVAPPVEEYVNLTCPTELLHVSGIDDVNKRSLCPWTYVADVDPDRYPSTIQIAKCRCPRCIDTSLAQEGAFSNENDCHQVLFRMKVLRRGPCVNGMYMYHNVYQDIPVACACLRPKVL